MTINELCNNQERCRTCPFYDSCTLLDCNPPFHFDDTDDKAITNSIIETAKALQEDNDAYGYWIKHTNNGIEYLECSNCSTWFIKFYLSRNSYCPNCGKKMRWKNG